MISFTVLHLIPYVVRIIFDLSCPLNKGTFDPINIVTMANTVNTECFRMTISHYPMPKL
jgi:hypothetical protein